MLKDQTALTENQILQKPKILFIFGDWRDSDKATKILKQIDSPIDFLPFVSIPHNLFALQAIKKHKDATWIIIDITHFVKPDLLLLVQTINPEIREKIICLIPPREEIERTKKEKLLEKNFPDLNLLKDSLKGLGVAHQVSEPTEYALCVSKKCSC